ncbi:hypothetical protein [Streptomyces sp. NPDC008121]|uniref:hypothetical protein n=1 Tax=Streptomyces sp. NPDC008121 TaxID=3364809 RepID=UPI0036E2F360
MQPGTRTAPEGIRKGLVDEGWNIFTTMIPSVQRYANTGGGLPIHAAGGHFDELVTEMGQRGLDKVTLYATYASVGLGTLERAHAGSLAAWDLIVADEAHRVSGRIGKPWASAPAPPSAPPAAITANGLGTASSSTATTMPG